MSKMGLSCSLALNGVTLSAYAKSSSLCSLTLEPDQAPLGGSRPNLTFYLSSIKNVEDGTRTHKALTTRTWIVRVYQFRHFDMLVISSYSYIQLSMSTWRMYSLTFIPSRKTILNCFSRQSATSTCWSLVLTHIFNCQCLLGGCIHLRSYPLEKQYSIVFLGRVPLRHVGH